MIKCNKACYNSFTSESHIQRLRNAVIMSEPLTLEAEMRNECESESSSFYKLTCRSSCMFDKKLCIFCQSENKDKTNRVMTMEMSDRILDLTKTDNIMRYRLAGFSDLIAADALYNLKCYVNFT